MATSTGLIESIAQSFVDAFNRRDAEGLVAVADPEVEFNPTPLVHQQSVYHGHDGLRHWLEEIAASGIGHSVRLRDVRRLDESRFLILADILIGDEPVSPLAILGRLSKEGKIVEAHAFLSDEQILEQVGVTPADPDSGSLSEPA